MSSLVIMVLRFEVSAFRETTGSFKSQDNLKQDQRNFFACFVVLLFQRQSALPTP